MLTKQQLAALDRAQEIAFDALDAESLGERLRLAKLAVKASEFCADAWLILAEFETPGSAVEFAALQRAVSAAKATLAPEAFEQDAGHFWSLLETRPYMRAILAVAQALWNRGERHEAIGHIRDMLRLNPNDNQGVRYQLASWLAIEGDGTGLRNLVSVYEDDDSAFMTWPLALVAFREFDATAARALLRVALASNQHVPGLLLGTIPIPVDPPEYYSPGEASEAAIYVQDFGDSWRDVPGAIDWLRQEVGEA